MKASTIAAEHGSPHREWVLVGAPLVAILLQLTLWGSNSTLLAAIAATINCVVVAVTLGLAPKAPGWPREQRLAFFCFGGALAWASLQFAPLQPAAWLRPIYAAAGARAVTGTPDESLVALAGLIGFGAMAISGAHLGRTPKRLKLIFEALCLSGGLYALLGLSLYQVSPDSILGAVKQGHLGRFTGTLFNANAAGSVFAVFAVITAALLRSHMLRMQALNKFMRRAEWPIVAGRALVLLVLIGACALTRSRTALVTMTIGLIVIGLGARPWNHKSTLRIAFGLGMITAAAFGFAGVNALRRPDLIENFTGRIAGYRLSFALASDAPWLGYGLGSFQAVFTSHLSLYDAPALWNFGAAHNVILQAALEGGWPFALFLVLAVAAWLQPSLTYRPAPGLRSLRQGGLVALAILAVAGFVDIALNVPAIASLAAFILGLCGAAGGWRFAAETPVNSQ